jgi:hypothetical protein
MMASGPSSAVEAHGIEVEGLDASSWAVPADGTAAVAVARTEPELAAATTPSDAASPFVAAAPNPSAVREYKLLTSRDKYFDGKFELGRLEEALNHFARLGWVAKSMSTPHVKNFTGVLEEVLVVLLERCHQAE